MKGNHLAAERRSSPLPGFAGRGRRVFEPGEGLPPDHLGRRLSSAAPPHPAAEPADLSPAKPGERWRTAAPRQRRESHRSRINAIPYDFCGSSPMSHLLKLTGVSKSFGGVRALRDVSFDLLPGEVHALVGENGAGKSTLIKVVTGAHQPDGGELVIRGQPLTGLDPLQARALGVAAIYQQPALFPDLTVAENIGIALEPPGVWRRVRWGERRARAAELLARIGARIDPDAEARTLTMPEQQLVEIAKAIGADAKVVIMDEPTAALADREVENL